MFEVSFRGQIFVGEMRASNSKVVAGEDNERVFTIRRVQESSMHLFPRSHRTLKCAQSESRIAACTGFWGEQDWTPVRTRYLILELYYFLHSTKCGEATRKFSQLIRPFGPAEYNDTVILSHSRQPCNGARTVRETQLANSGALACDEA